MRIEQIANGYLLHYGTIRKGLSGVSFAGDVTESYDTWAALIQRLLVLGTCRVEIP